MRRLAAPLVVFMLAAIGGMLVFGVLRGGGSVAPRKSQYQQQATSKKSPSQVRAEAAADNAVILAAIPLPPATRFFTKEDAAAPHGGSHISTHAHFANPAARDELVAHFKSAMTQAGWKQVGELTVPSRAEVKFQKDAAWVSVAATDIEIDGKPTPGFTITVNAKEAEKMAAG